MKGLPHGIPFLNDATRARRVIRDFDNEIAVLKAENKQLKMTLRNKCSEPICPTECACHDICYGKDSTEQEESK